MNKGLLGHSLFSLATVAVAYAAWTLPVDGQSKTFKTSVLPDNYGELTRIEWQESTEQHAFRVSLTRDQDQVEVQVERKSGEADPVVTAFPGSARAEKLFDELRTIEATRNLGQLDGPRQESLGLGAEADRSLKLSFGSREVMLPVGHESFGTGNYYVKSPSEEVHLVSSQVLGVLRRGAAGLLDRRVVGLEPEKIERVVLSDSTGRRREFVRRELDPGAQPQGEGGFFADPAEPDVKLDEATAWIERVLRLHALEQRAELKTAGKPAIRVEVFGESNRVVEIWPSRDPKHGILKSSRFSTVSRINGVAGTRLIEDAAAVFDEKSKSTAPKSAAGETVVPPDPTE